MGVFSLVIEQTFSVLGDAAIYRTKAGSVKNINVMARRPDEVIGIDGTSIKARSALFDVRVADIAIPVRGDEIEFLNTTYIVQDAAYLDGDRMVWRVDTYPK